jgi:phosphate transport system substrate-binding protein
MKWIVPIFLLLLFLLLNDWSGGKGEAVNVIGSNSVAPFAEVLAEEYNRKAGTARVDVQGLGSTVGVQQTRIGTADIGMVSRSLKPEEAAEFQQVTIAFDGLAIIVHPTNPVTGLSVEQVRAIFKAEIPNWKAVGGRDAPITLVVREESSGTREAFAKLVMHEQRVSRKAINQDSNGAIRELVKSDPNAIGFISLGLVTPEVKPLKMDGIEATAKTVAEKDKARRYPLVRPFLFITKGKPSAKAQPFIDYVLSPEAQASLAREGLVRVR